MKIITTHARRRPQDRRSEGAPRAKELGEGRPGVGGVQEDRVGRDGVDAEGAVRRGRVVRRRGEARTRGPSL